MTLFRFSVSIFLLVAILAFVAESPACAQIVPPIEIEFIKNGEVYDEDTGPYYIVGPHQWYEGGAICPNTKHRTKNSISHFDHVHVIVPNPLVASELVGGVLGGSISFTLAHVKAYWDEWALDEKEGRSAVSYSSDGSEDLTRNCFGFSFDYDTWIQNSAPFYNENDGDYGKVAGSLSERDVIRKGGHVITITSINHCESPYLVAGTSEKMRHSRIYHFLYEYPEGLGVGYKDYYRRK